MSPADLSLRQVGESYKDYAARMAGWARAAEIDRDRLRGQRLAILALHKRHEIRVGDIQLDPRCSHCVEPDVVALRNRSSDGSHRVTDLVTARRDDQPSVGKAIHQRSGVSSGRAALRIASGDDPVVGLPPEAAEDHADVVPGLFGGEPVAREVVLERVREPYPVRRLSGHACPRIALTVASLIPVRRAVSAGPCSATSARTSAFRSARASRIASSRSAMYASAAAMRARPGDILRSSCSVRGVMRLTIHYVNRLAGYPDKCYSGRMTTTVIATSTFGRKVHLAPFGRMICGNTGVVDSVIADLGDEGGLDETLTALTSARVAPSKLCSKCFMGRTRAAYMKRCSA